jgi:hypothetical protein
LVNLQDLCLLGQALHGIYVEVADVDPILLHQFYGAGSPIPNNKDTDLDLEDPKDYEEPNPGLEDFHDSGEENSSSGSSNTNVESNNSKDDTRSDSGEHDVESWDDGSDTDGENSESGMGSNQNHMVLKMLR